MKRIRLLLWLFFKTNFIKTIFFNYKMFPLKVACKLPIVFKGRVNTKGCDGEIFLTEPVKTAMVIVGVMPEEIFSKRYLSTRFKISGSLYVGSNIQIRGGGAINVTKNGILTLGGNTLINSYTRIWCENKIIIGLNTRLSWECQVFDSNFHYLVDNSGYTTKCLGEVIIGENVWVGNKVTINKGTVLPNKTIVGSGSFVNKDFSQYGEGCIVAGMPATFIKSGYRRLFDYDKQTEVDEFFKNNPNESKYFVGNEIN